MAIKIMCSGDSNTEGVGTAAGPPYINAYPKQLEILLNADKHGVVITNLGYSGYTSEMLTPYYDAMASEHFDIALVMIGTNDVAAFGYTAGLTPAQSAARHRIAIEALLLKIKEKFTPDLIGWIIPISPKWGSVGSSPPWTESLEPTYNAIVAESFDFALDNKYKGVVIIKGNLCITPVVAGNYNDSLHMSLQGAGVLAKYIRDRITLKF